MADSLLDTIAPAFARYIKLFRRCFTNQNNFGHFDHCGQGLLAELPRKTVEPIALAVGTAVRTLQEFFSSPITGITMRSATNCIATSSVNSDAYPMIRLAPEVLKSMSLRLTPEGPAQRADSIRPTLGRGEAIGSSIARRRTRGGLCNSVRS